MQSLNAYIDRKPCARWHRSETKTCSNDCQPKSISEEGSIKMFRSNGHFQKAKNVPFGSIVIAKRHGVSFPGLVFGWGEADNEDMYILNLDDPASQVFSPPSNDPVFELENCRFVAYGEPSTVEFVAATNGHAGWIGVGAGSTFLLMHHEPTPMAVNIDTGLVQIGAPLNIQGFLTGWNVVQLIGTAERSIAAFRY
jgi:hypothetical protein